MEVLAHDLAGLFAQLGLASDVAAIENFIAAHAPLAAEVRLHEAPFWSAGQAAFLRESWLQDSDWVEVIDLLNTKLHA